PIAVSRRLRHGNGLDVHAAHIEPPDAAGRSHPHPTGLVCLETVRNIFARLSENVSLTQGAVARDVIHVYVALSAVGDVQLLLVRSERYAVGPLAIFGDDADFTLASHLINRGRRQIGKINAAVDRIYQVIGFLHARDMRPSARAFPGACHAGKPTPSGTTGRPS